MGRIGSEHFNRKGKPKKGYDTKQEAQDFLHQQREGHIKHVYTCGLCGKYHIGAKLTHKQAHNKETSYETLLRKMNELFD